MQKSSSKITSHVQTTILKQMASRLVNLPTPQKYPPQKNEAFFGEVF